MTEHRVTLPLLFIAVVLLAILTWRDCGAWNVVGGILVVVLLSVAYHILERRW